MFLATSTDPSVIEQLWTIAVAAVGAGVFSILGVGYGKKAERENAKSGWQRDRRLDAYPDGSSSRTRFATASARKRPLP